jgi:hypothetical protein
MLTKREDIGWALAKKKKRRIDNLIHRPPAK